MGEKDWFEDYMRQLQDNQAVSHVGMQLDVTNNQLVLRSGISSGGIDLKWTKEYKTFICIGLTVWLY